VIAAMLLLAAQAPLAPPAETGLQPPMSFACRGDFNGGPLEIKGRISRFFLNAGGGGLFVAPVGDAYQDHIVFEIMPTPFPGLAGRYDIVARFPIDTDRMVMTLPAAGGNAPYALTATPVRFGVGYQSFTSMTLRRRDPAAPIVWSGTCTTILPEPGRKKS
jgi:hypothetical protein